MEWPPTELTPSGSEAALFAYLEEACRGAEMRGAEAVRGAALEVGAGIEVELGGRVEAEAEAGDRASEGIGATVAVMEKETDVNTESEAEDTKR